MSRDLEVVPLNTDNPEPRVVCTVLVDASSSMEGEPIRELNKGFADFRRFLRDDELASRRTEVAVIEFGSSARVAIPLQEGRSLPSYTFQANGLTAMGSAINKALDMVEARKRDYRAEGIEYYRPWIVVFSDGAPTDADEFERAVQRLADVAQHKGATVFPIGIGSRANLPTLSRLSMPQRPAMRLAGVNFSAFFEWLSASMSAVASSQICGSNDDELAAMTEQVQLADISGWAIA
ncbi:MAG: VWA domain-containing protein [Micrococcales bacterium]|nr:VWA domain-containing protein [Micrococcales bacterium]